MTRIREEDYNSAKAGGVMCSFVMSIYEQDNRLVNALTDLMSTKLSKH